MNVTLVTLLNISSIVAGEPRVICPDETVVTVEGRNVSLQYRLVPLENESGTFDVRRVDLDVDANVVFFYRRGQDHPDAQILQYRDRVTLVKLDLKRGILILQISSVKQSDSGQYRLFVARQKAGCNFYLTVDQQNGTKRSDSSTTGPRAKEETEPDDRDAAKKEAVTDIPSVVGGVVAVVVAVAAVAVIIFILVKRGKIRMRALRGRDFEMENLRGQTAEGDEDPHRAAENAGCMTITIHHLQQHHTHHNPGAEAPPT